MSSKSQAKSKATPATEIPQPENQDDLEPHQQRALDQLRELTNGADVEVSIAVLRSVEWDVQRAAELIFESSSQPSSIPIPKPSSPLPSSSSSASLSSLGSDGPALTSTLPVPFATFEIDDSQVQNHRPTPSPMGLRLGLYLPRPLITILAFPFHILTALVRFVFGVLRIPLPRLPGGIGLVRFAGLGLFGTNGSRRGDGRVGYGEGWLREVEEETGAVWLGRVVRGPGTGDGAASGIDVNAASGSGSVTRRGGKGQINWGTGRKYLPDFELCGYEEFLRMCIKEKKVGCVILVSEEHDDVLGFKRGALVDQGFVRRLYDAGVLCWGGDVRDREAWSAAEKLQATTYPFVAFIALQSRRGANVLTVLSRHQGKSSTSASTLTSHLDTHVLPRVLPFLTTLLQEEKGRETDRRLRAEQDRAYEESQRRDREKWEREQRERLREEKERARKEGEEREKVERQKRRVEMGRKVWSVVGVLRGGPEGTDKGKGKQKQPGEGVRIVVRMPGGERIVEKFSRDESVSVLYAVVDRFLVGGDRPSQSAQVVDGDVKMDEGELEALIKQEGGKEFWGFKIVSAYPRKEIEWREGVRIGEVDVLVGGGQVVVERDVVMNGGGDGDGCETEEEE